MRSAYIADMMEVTEATAFLLSTGTACIFGSFEAGVGVDKLSLDLLPAALQRGKVSSAVAAAFADCFSMAVHFIRYANIPHQSLHTLCSFGSYTFLSNAAASLLFMLVSQSAQKI